MLMEIKLYNTCEPIATVFFILTVQTSEHII